MRKIVSFLIIVLIPLSSYGMERNRRKTFIKIPSKEQLELLKRYQALKKAQRVTIEHRVFVLKHESDNPDDYERRRHNKKSKQEQKNN